MNQLVENATYEASYLLYLYHQEIGGMIHAQHPTYDSTKALIIGHERTTETAI